MTKLVVAGSAVALGILLAGSAALAWGKLSGGGAQPHDVLPASVIAYVRIDGDPSAAQKIKLLHLLRKSPDLAAELGITNDKQDLRKTFVKSLLSDCDVDFEKDVAPWVGNRFGAGVAKGGKTGYLAIEVSDEKSARKGLDLMADCLGLDDPGIVFAHGYALLGEGQRATEAAAKEAARSPLADNATFTQDMDSLGDEGIVSVWADTKPLGNTLGVLGGSLSTTSPADKALDQTRSAAASLRAGDDNIELGAISHQRKDIGKVTPVDLGKLPNAAVLAASFSGGGRQVAKHWSSLNEAMGQFDSTRFLDDIESQTGFVLPADLGTLLGDNITLVAGDRNLAKVSQLEGPGGVEDIDVAIALHSDSAKAVALANRIAARVSRRTGVRLAVLKTGDGAVLATNDAFARSFTKGRSLRESKSFRSVISDENSAFGGFYLDIARAVEVARGTDAPPAGVNEVLRELKALGLSITNDGTRVMRATLRLSFR